MDLSSVPVAVSYSDGEGADAGVGVALWLPGKRAKTGFLKVPPSVRELWGRCKRAETEYMDICEVEAIGPAIILESWGRELQNMLWLHFIDNESALASLVKGSSSVLSGELITAFTHEHVARWSILPWFDRVDSKSNPVDGLSRGDMRGEWDLVPVEFPKRLAASLDEFLASSRI